MATPMTELKKMQREIDKLKKRVERLERRNGKRNTTKNGSTRKLTSRNLGKTTRPRRNQRSTPQTLSTSRRGLEEGETPKPDLYLRSLFGSVDMGYPTGADNESIDRDLAKEYASTHAED